MSWATKRRLIYVSIFMAVIGLFVVFPAYFLLRREPTCFDGRQNQNEEGRDCGGVCATVCRVAGDVPITVWTRAFEVSPGVYSVAAYAQNQNVSSQAVDVPYTFKLYGPNNVFLAERSGTTNIPAGRAFAVFESNFILIASTSVRVDFALDADRITWTRTADSVPLTILDEKIINEPSLQSVEADIYNASLDDVGKIIATAIVYDAEGNAFAASQTVVDNIAPRTSEHIVFTWPRPFMRQPARVEIIPIIQ